MFKFQQTDGTARLHTSLKEIKAQCPVESCFTTVLEQTVPTTTLLFSCRIVDQLSVPYGPLQYCGSCQMAATAFRT